MSKQNLAKEFKKLEIFVDNTDVGVFVAEVNDIRTQAEIIHFLEEKNQVKKVDFDKIKDSFVYELRNSTSNKGITVFYNFIYDKIDYNIVKTLNLSREILKDIGKVIFLLPSYLVWQIQYETPNLRDYVLCFFDFNEKMKMPFEPIFAIDDHVFRTKDERTRLKKLGYQIKNISSIQSIDDFFEYLNTLDYKKITKKEIDVIENTVWSIYSQIKEKKLNDSEENYILLEEKLFRKVGWTYAKQALYKEASDIFDLLGEIGGENDKFISIRLHEHEGKAYCMYHSKKYSDAKRELLMMLNIFEKSEIDFSVWKARVYNDYANCFFMERKYKEASDVLEQSYEILIESKGVNINRKFRYLYNKALLKIMQGECFYKYMEMYDDFLEELNVNNKISVIYAKYSIIIMWIKGIIEGKLTESLNIASECLNCTRTIFPENDIQIANVHITVGNILLLKGESEKAENHFKKAENIKKARGL